MNGPHDLGGQHGLGPIAPEPDEPWFHADWERRAFALTLAMGLHGRWNLDESRHVRENRHPVDYLGSSYYELWLKSLETLILRHGFVTPEELQSGRAAAPAPLAAPGPGDTAGRLARGFSTRVDADVPPRFAAGQRVLVKDTATTGHTRAPRYCRGRIGVIDRDHGVFVFPDTHAHGGGRKPQHVYSVRFAARTLWGEQAAARDEIFIDLWDDYLEPAP